MQVVATGWLVLQLTNSAADIGVNAAVQGVPILLFALVGGVVADRFDRYWLMVGSQVAMIVPDALLTYLVATNQVHVEHVYAYSLVTGFLNGVATPARRALVPHLVKREVLLSAMALDGIVWQGAAVVGPAAAGVTIAAWGLAAPFLINVVSDFVGVGALLPIKDRAPRITHTTSAWRNVGEGLRYSWNMPTVRWLLLNTAALSLLGRAYSSLAPVFAQDVFHAGPQGLGIITTMPAAGVIVASAFLAFSGTTARPQLFLVGALGSSIFLAIFATSPWFPLALGVLLLIGASSAVAQTMSSTLLQQTVAEHMRGRVMSLLMACTLAAWRLAALPFGFAAQQWGAPIAADAGAVLLFITLIASSRFMPARIDRPAQSVLAH